MVCPGSVSYCVSFVRIIRYRKTAMPHNINISSVTVLRLWSSVSDLRSLRNFELDERCSFSSFLRTLRSFEIDELSL